MMQKSISAALPRDRTFGMITSVASTLSVSERSCRDIQIARYNLEYSKKCFHYLGLKDWNNIPIAIRELSTLQ